MHPLASPEAEDAELARRIASAAPGRDVAAEAELCRRFAPRVRLYGLKHLRNEAAAADLAQDVLLMVLQKLRAQELRELVRLAEGVRNVMRKGDVPAVPTAAFIRRIQQSGLRVREYRSATQRVQLVAVDPAAERVIGDYTFNHSPYGGA